MTVSQQPTGMSPLAKLQRVDEAYGLVSKAESAGGHLVQDTTSEEGAWSKRYPDSAGPPGKPVYPEGSMFITRTLATGAVASDEGENL